MALMGRWEQIGSRVVHCWVGTVGTIRLSPLQIGTRSNVRVADFRFQIWEAVEKGVSGKDILFRPGSFRSREVLYNYNRPVRQVRTVDLIPSCTTWTQKIRRCSPECVCTTTVSMTNILHVWCSRARSSYRSFLARLQCRLEDSLK